MEKEEVGALATRLLVIMKFKTTIILIIIAIIGAAYVFLYERRQESAEDRYVHGRKIFFGLNTDLVFKVEVIKNGRKFLFLKDIDGVYGGVNGRWVMEEPVRTVADQAVINGFLSELEFMEKVSRFQDGGGDHKGGESEDYGLDDPTFAVKFWTGQIRAGQETAIRDADGLPVLAQPVGVKEHSFVIGHRVSTGKHVYAQVAGSDEALVISDAVALKLDYKLSGFRDKWVMDIDMDAVTRLEIERGAEDDISCAKTEDLWRMSRPVVDRCDNKKIAEIIESLKALRVNEDDFVSDAESGRMQYGLDSPRFHVVVEQNGVRTGVAFGHTLDNQVYARRDGEDSVFLVGDLILNELAVSPDILRSRDMVRFETVAGTLGIDRLQIDTRHTAMTIKKTADYDWKIMEPVEILADANVVKELVEEIKDLRIQEFVTNRSDDLSQYGLENPVFGLSVYKDKVDEPTRILFGDLTNDGNECYVKRPDEDPVFTITSKGPYEKLLGGLLAFQDKLVVYFEKSGVRELVIENADTTFVINKSDGGKSTWVMSEPVSDMPDGSVVDQIVHNLSFLKTSKYVLKIGDGTNGISGFGLDNPVIKVTVSYDDVQSEEHGGGVNGQPASHHGGGGGAAVEQGGGGGGSTPAASSVTLLVGNRIAAGDDANYFAMVEGNGFVFELDGEIVDGFNAELVSRSIQRFNPSKVKRLTLSYKGADNVFERPKGVWVAVKPAWEEINARMVEFLIWQLSDLRAERILEYNLNNVIDYGLDSPVVRAAVILDDDSLFEVLAVDNNQGDNYFVMSRNSNCIYEVDSEVIRTLIEQEIIPGGVTTQIAGPDTSSPPK